MQFDFKTENKENSQMLLKVTVDKVEVKKNYDELLLDAQKNAVVDGFRKGKVPASVLEMRYKEGFLAETANKLIDDSYKEIFEKLEKKPLAYAMPKLEKFDMPNLDNDFIYELLFDVYPEFKIGEYKGLEVVKDEVKISDEDIKAELERHLKEFATVESKDGKISKDDIVSADYTVTLDDKEVYKKDNEYIHVGKDYDYYKIGDDLIGFKKDDEKEFSKTYDKDAIETLAGKTYNFKIKIKDVKKEIIPELTDDLAKQINDKCQTVAELKDTVTKNLEEFATNAIKQKALNKIIKQISSTFDGTIPQSMIDQQIDSYYNELVQRFRGDEKRVLSLLKKDNLTKESYREKMKDQAIKEIKRALILSDIVKKESITVTEEEIKKHMEPFAKYYNSKIDELFELFKKAGNLKVFENEVEIQKALDFLFDNAKVKKGKN